MHLSSKLLISLLIVFSLFSSQLMANESLQTTKVLLETNKGNIELELYPEKAPLTVANFLRYVDEGFYKGTIFHRVINSFMIQGGGYDAAMKKKDVHDNIQNEADNGLKNERGTIAMARTSSPHSATAQFFFNHVDNDFLNHTERSTRGWGYCVFGRVTKGMKTVDAIADVFTHTVNGMKNVPEETVIINNISRI